MKLINEGVLKGWLCGLVLGSWFPVRRDLDIKA